MRIRGHSWDILAVSIWVVTAILYIYWPMRVNASDEARPIDVRVNAATTVASWLLADSNLTQAQVAEILDLAKAHYNQVTTAKLWPVDMPDIDRRFDSLRWAWGGRKGGMTAALFNKAWNWSAPILAWVQGTAT